MEYSARIYGIYLNYMAKEDIHVYSVDECFMDVTRYLSLYHLTAKEMAQKLMDAVMEETGITATAGIGTNLYLCKIAMDIGAKHVKPDKNGARIAGLDEMTYRKLLWNHRPITDFWRVGRGYAKRLEKYGIYTMGDVAKTSIENEDLLYKLFGINAELLIDHSWGWEPATMQSIKAFRPATKSINLGQVLHCPYTFNDAETIIKNMANSLSNDLVKKNLVTSKIVLDINYDKDNLIDSTISTQYRGETTEDRYGRKVPKSAHGTINLEHKTSSAKAIIEVTSILYKRITDKRLLIRKLYITADDVTYESNTNDTPFEQIDLFTDYEKANKKREKEIAEKNMQKAVINLQDKYGKNAVLRGMDLLKESTTIERNSQVGGHKA